MYMPKRDISFRTTTQWVSSAPKGTNVGLFVSFPYILALLPLTYRVVPSVVGLLQERKPRHDRLDRFHRFLVLRFRLQEPQHSIAQ